MDDCVFCKIVKKELPCKMVVENTYSIAFLDIYPVNPGHTLIVPKKHYSHFHDVPTEELHHIIELVQRVAGDVPKKMGATDYNVTLNNGVNAGQIVFHMHFHVIPRFGKDRDKHSGAKATDSELDAVLAKIKSKK